MSGLFRGFTRESAAAVNLARAGEVARAGSPSGSSTRRLLHYSTIEYLYEAAYLRLFVRWESFLEASFYRYMCGYECSQGQQTLVQPASYRPSIAAAESDVLGTRSYILWHNPTYVVKRSQKYFVNGRHELVINSVLSLLEHYANIRHRIAHGQSDARTKFDAATMHLAARHYHGSRPGRFLRDQHPSGVRQLERIATDLVALAKQIVP